MTARLLAAIDATERVLLAGAAKASKPEDYDVLRAGYVNDLFDAFIGFGSSGGSVTKWRNAAGRAVLDAVAGAIEGAFFEVDAELDSDDRAWLKDMQAAQREFLPAVFDWLKEQRDAETITENSVTARAESWGNGLDGIRSEAVLRASKNVMLEFDGDDGDESCADCQKLKGKRRSTKWVLEHDMIPRPGNENFDCNGYHCQHYWKNAKTGEQVTI